MYYKANFYKKNFLTYNLAHVLNHHTTLITKFFLYIIPSNYWATETTSQSFSKITQKLMGYFIKFWNLGTVSLAVSLKHSAMTCIETITQQRVKGGSGPFPGPFDTIQQSRTVGEADLFNPTLLARALYVLARSGV